MYEKMGKHQILREKALTGIIIKFPFEIIPFQPQKPNNADTWLHERKLQMCSFNIRGHCSDYAQNGNSVHPYPV